jgi:cytochrome c oxidase subunit IV
VTDLFRHRGTVVWAALVAATLVSSVLGTSAHGGVQVATAGALAIAFLKVRYVGLDFMEVRGAAAPLRAAFEGWVLVVGAVVVGLYLLA